MRARVVRRGAPRILEPHGRSHGIRFVHRRLDHPPADGRQQEFLAAPQHEEVHSYGVETKASLDVRLAAEWRLALDSGTFGWTPSINRSEPLGDNDQSVGKQLVYVPEFSSAVTGRLDWRTWRLTTTSGTTTRHATPCPAMTTR